VFVPLDRNTQTLSYEIYFSDKLKMHRLFFILIALMSCSQKENVRSSKYLNRYETTKNYFTSSTTLTIEVAYESGHEPYTDTNITLSNGNPTPLWNVLDENLNALFLGRTPYPNIVVPKALADMNEIPVQGKTSWSVSELVDLAKEHRKGKSSASHSYFWVVFVGGHFNDGANNQTSMVGVSLGGTTIIAVFKDVVRNTGNEAGLTPRYVEQATLVHELGHALGLVNNGLTMHDPHQDTGHGNHCNNPDCVMYWLNEGREDLKGFVANMILRQTVIMYDQKCLDDARKF